MRQWSCVVCMRQWSWVVSYETSQVHCRIYIRMPLDLELASCLALPDIDMLVGIGCGVALAGLHHPGCRRCRAVYVELQMWSRLLSTYLLDVKRQWREYCHGIASRPLGGCVRIFKSATCRGYLDLSSSHHRSCSFARQWACRWWRGVRHPCIRLLSFAYPCGISTC